MVIFSYPSALNVISYGRDGRIRTFTEWDLNPLPLPSWATSPYGRRGEIRTPNPLRARDFKSLMYTVPTLSHKCQFLVSYLYCTIPILVTGNHILKCILWCEWKDSNLHCYGPKPYASAKLGYTRFYTLMNSSSVKRKSSTLSNFVSLKILRSSIKRGIPSS